ncbi:putative UDP-Glycosyltransferase/glycogen phosphorylase [Vibrio nigripulchritudo MADA3029]|uniref:glycosyltransferase family 4 protein n=1 Tax=Vibrio nigripulchritudo TaxID=28173 RepID=UPI0003B234EE|nr:glycosyltransferase family 4 protein [Vibrio nigripulchritudo]CCN47596.1 putative UDP-Glycosyltransferase/glycogen phosphorylase [Vibrio nigripulchritudo MADA3020]CCN56580.1 putative UDP-Glycosyltransferase/glycogen phosphorylase [Vibrio nigripulchritudo MADA3021]CCN58795.1 putative UDP-Glycosyltransferase/glycogen phosphorylase [Vibrio nigripulchritudo MADA3029]
MGNPKVAIVCLSHFQGGMELDAIKHADMFNRHGINSVLICRKKTYLENAANQMNFPTFSIDFKAKLGIALIRSLRKIIKQQSISTLIFFGTSEIKSIYFAVKGLDCQVILRHGTTMSSPKTDVLHSWFYSCVSSYVSISDHLNNNIKQIFPVSNKSVTTIYNPVDASKTQSSKAKSKCFLHVGRVEEGKGVFDAVVALGKADIPRECKSLTFVGAFEFDAKDRLEKLAKQEQVNVSFEGFVSDPTPLYQSHSFLLFPSHGEGLGNTILEGLQSNQAAICYGNTVFPELKELGFENMYLADHLNTDSLAKQIEAAFHNASDEAINPNLSLLEKYFSETYAIQKWSALI